MLTSHNNAMICGLVRHIHQAESDFMPLTIQAIQQLSSPASYQRGQQYYQQGRVEQLSKRGQIYHARVVGSVRYQVQLNPDHHDDVRCSCPAFFDYDGWCKHLVAVSMAVLHQQTREPVAPPSIPEKSPKPSKVPSALPADIQQIIQQLSDAEKNSLFEELLLQHPEIFAALRIRFHENYDVPNLIKMLKKCVNALKRTDDRYTYSKHTSAFLQILQEHPRDWPLSEKASLARVQLVDYVYQQLEEIDDSSGKIQQACDQLLQQVISDVETRGKSGILTLQVALQTLDPDSEVRDVLLNVMLESPHPDVQAWWRQLLEQSNVREIREFGLPRQTFQTRIAHILSAGGNPLFLSHLDDFEMVDQLDQLRAGYHYARREWQDYLAFNQHDILAYRLSRQIEALKALEQWETLASVLEQQLSHSKTHHSHQAEHLALYQQVLDRLNLSTQQHHARLGQTLTGLVSNMTDLQLKVPMLLSLQDYQQVATLILDWWTQRFAAQGGSTTMHGSGMERTMYEALRQLSDQSAEHAIPLHHTLLAFEQQRLTQKSYNQYGNIYRLIEQLKHLGQDDEIRAFQQHVITHYASRKKLVDWLNQVF